MFILPNTNLSYNMLLCIFVIGPIIKCGRKTACKCWSDWSKADHKCYLKRQVGLVARKGVKNKFSLHVTDAVSV
jgi:hypothetical protein